MIKEAYCSFEVSKLLKEKGFPQLLGDDNCVNRIPYYCPKEKTIYFDCYEEAVEAALKYCSTKKI